MWRDKSVDEQWKVHLLVLERIVLGHKISRNGMKYDKAKVEVIEKFTPPITMKGVRNFWDTLGSTED